MTIPEKAILVLVLISFIVIVWPYPPFCYSPSKRPDARLTAAKYIATYTLLVVSIIWIFI